MHIRRYERSSYNGSSNNPMVCVIVGIVFMLVSVFMIKMDIDIKNSMDSQTLSNFVTHERIERRDSNNKRQVTYAPIYHYSVNGKNYQCHTNSSSSFRSGTNRTVYYQSQSPAECFVDEKDFFFKAIFFIVGFFVAFIGIREVFKP